MEKIYCPEIPRTYRNNGQHAQQRAENALLGTISKADNIPHTAGADFLHYQVKSARATICQGLDLARYLTEDKAKAFIYVAKTEWLYIMDKAEYIAFCLTFATATKESTKNGGHLKMRLGHETKALLDYLEARIEQGRGESPSPLRPTV